MRINNLAIVVGAALVFAGSMIAVAATQNRGGPSTAKEVAGPSVGPAGQTGELHYLENTARRYAGDAQDFGPFRLLPAGTQYIPRPLPTELTGKPTPHPVSLDELKASQLWVDAPEGLELAQASGDEWLGKAINAQFLWRTADGKSVQATVSIVEDWQKPLDVYLVYPDSLLRVAPVMIDGHYAIVNEPSTGPAPNVGYVSVFVNNKLLYLSSPDLDQKALQRYAAILLPAIRP